MARRAGCPALTISRGVKAKGKKRMIKGAARKPTVATDLRHTTPAVIPGKPEDQSMTKGPGGCEVHRRSTGGQRQDRQRASPEPSHPPSAHAEHAAVNPGTLRAVHPGCAGSPSRSSPPPSARLAPRPRPFPNPVAPAVSSSPAGRRSGFGGDRESGKGLRPDNAARADPAEIGCAPFTQSERLFRPRLEIAPGPYGKAVIIHADWDLSSG
jgi:hypothetical protein